MKVLIGFAFLWLLASCSGTPDRILDEAEISAAEEEKAPTKLIRALRNPDSEWVLDIALLRFKVAKSNSANQIGSWIFDEILEIESQYLPTVLRKALMDSNQWGVVRVLPKEDLSMDISVQSTIIQSDGIALKLRVIAQDSTGREWIDKEYAQTNLTDLIDNELHGSSDQDPFQDIYNQISNDLLAIQKSLSYSEIQNIKRVSEIRHASDLSPETFADLISRDDDGLLRVNRQLADNDPMLKRVERMQLRHNIFIDTLDDYYLELNREMQPVYDLWRYYSREQILEIETELRRDEGKSKNSSGFTAIANNYYRYKANKLFEQEWTELASGFTNELEPTILELEDQVYGLSGSVEDQYVQWREILKQFYLYDRGAQ